MNIRRTLTPLVPLAAIAALLSGCGAGSDQVADQVAASTGQVTSRSTPAPRSDTAPVVRRTSARKATNRVTKTLVFVVENHSLAQMKAGMPWVYNLAERYGYASQYYATTHPSLPNYLAIAGGSTYGVRDDNSPAKHRLSGPTVLGRAIRAGRTARVYGDAMPYNCTTSNAGKYAVRHNPWTYFPAERAKCNKYDVPMGTHLFRDAARGTLPNVGMVIPNLCDDAHDCVLANADNWIRSVLTRVMAGPDFSSGRLAIVITADEDNKKSGNHVLTVVAQRSLRHKVVRTRLNHYGLSRSLSQVGHSAPLHKARTARSALAAFGLRLG